MRIFRFFGQKMVGLDVFDRQFLKILNNKSKIDFDSRDRFRSFSNSRNLDVLTQFLTSTLSFLLTHFLKNRIDFYANLYILFLTVLSCSALTLPTLRLSFYPVICQMSNSFNTFVNSKLVICNFF